jgi:hypothetical protein
MQTDLENFDHHQRRSEFVRSLIQRKPNRHKIDARYEHPAPRAIVQFWHDLQRLPDDVGRCISSWAPLEGQGYTHKLFDALEAKRFITVSLGERHASSFDRCYHPAMQADYFRLCYLWIEGGFYVDADDTWTGMDICWLFEDCRLKLQPLCYDVPSAAMIDSRLFLHDRSFNPDRIFYFNNNPLVTGAGHPVVGRALDRATTLLQCSSISELPEIQSTTGPGNLTRCIFELGTTSPSAMRSLRILHDWDSIAVSQWPLSYRNDSRNWRLSNQKRFE